MSAVTRIERGASAPELVIGLPWLNCPRPLTPEDLQGHVTIVYFWSYASAASLHVVRAVLDLEEQLADAPLLVIGVHSPQLDGQRAADRVLDAIDRHEIDHPVIVDSEWVVRRAWGSPAWPTVFVLDERSRVVEVLEGDLELERIEQVARRALDRAKALGTLRRASGANRCERAQAEESLRFPGKLCVSADGLLVISDTQHHRLVVARSDGSVVEVIGSGHRGYSDGSFKQASFSEPQGVCFGETADIIYVADSGSHTVRKVSLTEQQVQTLVGTGRMGSHPVPRLEIPGVEAPLRSPRGVCFAGGALWITLAGSHQVLRVRPRQGLLQDVVGSGELGLNDGAFEEARFAQPSGITGGEGRLFVADSASSSVRELDPERRTVRTLVAGSLFTGGDADGPRERARLQHLEGISLSHDGHELIVTDTYNHKLKRIDIASGSTRTFFHFANGIGLREPAGLWVSRALDAVFVADTGNHRVLRVSSDGREAAILPVRLHASTPPPVAVLALEKSVLVLRFVLDDAPSELRLTVSVRPESSWLLAELSELQGAPNVDTSIRLCPNPAHAEALRETDEGGIASWIRISVTAWRPQEGEMTVLATAAYRFLIAFTPSGEPSLEMDLALPTLLA